MVTHIRNDWPELIPILNKALVALRQKELPGIINKWFGQWPREPIATRDPLTPKERAWLNAHPEITLGTSASYPPHVVTNPDGTYTGDGNRDIEYDGKSITGRSENGPENCIIDCQGTEEQPHRGFDFVNRECWRAVLDGLTITNGMTSRGGGLR